MMATNLQKEPTEILSVEKINKSAIRLKRINL